MTAPTPVTTAQPSIASASKGRCAVHDHGGLFGDDREVGEARGAEEVIQVLSARVQAQHAGRQAIPVRRFVQAIEQYDG